MTDLRVALAPGRHLLRVAVSGDGAPRLVAELPAGTDPHAALSAFIGPRAGDVLVVHGPDPPDVAGCTGWRAVPVPVAAAAGRACVVLDVGRSGAHAARVDDGAIVAAARSPVGGDRLDVAVLDLLDPTATLPDARRIRQELALQPRASHGGRTVTAPQLAEVLIPLLDEIVAALAAVLDGPGPILLVGGVARAPLLAERVDAAGLVDPRLVEVLAQPDVAPVLRALTLPALTPPALTLPVATAPPVTAVLAVPPAAVLSGAIPTALVHAGPVEAPAVAVDPPSVLPPPPPSRSVRRLVGAGVITAALAALAGTGTAVALSRAAPAAAASSTVGVLVQYGYRIAVPAGWEHTGGLPERRRSLLTRIGAPDGTDLIAVERTPLGYDSDAEPERARTELRAVYDDAVAGGSELSGYGPARFGGRETIAYRQRERSGAEVEWYVVLEGVAQLSVGCRHTPTGADAVRTACATVVASAALT